MLVRELITKLSAMPQHYTVMIADGDLTPVSHITSVQMDHGQAPNPPHGDDSDFVVITNY